ncbi:MAG: hypothetical protein ACXVXC_15915 [Nocardioidaceae bacterium]
MVRGDLVLAVRAPGLGVTVAPRAAGRHASYDQVPERVRRWVESALGAPVVAAEEQAGGMSPGCATRLVTADGRRAFVKAVGPELNAHTPDLFRHEQRVLTHLGPDPLWAGLLSCYDEPDGWVGLLLEDVEGRHPDLASPADARLVLATVEVFVDRLAGRGRGRGLGIGSLPDSLTRYGTMWPALPEVPADLLPGWAKAEAPAMVDRLAALVAVAAGDHLVNFDIRNDNLLVRPSGEVVFVDWGMSRVGASWLDPLVARLEYAEDPSFDDHVGSSPRLRRLGDAHVTTFLYLIGCWLAYRTATDSGGPPGLHEFRRRESARFLAGARRRLGR